MMTSCRTKIKPCICGEEENIKIDCERITVFTYCAVVWCLQSECVHLPVFAMALTRRGAIKKAIKEWNRRSDNG